MPTYDAALMRRYYFHEAFCLSAHQAGDELPGVFAFHRPSSKGLKSTHCKHSRLEGNWLAGSDESWALDYHGSNLMLARHQLKVGRLFIIDQTIYCRYNKS